MGRNDGQLESRAASQAAGIRSFDLGSGLERRSLRIANRQDISMKTSKARLFILALALASAGAIAQAHAHSGPAAIRSGVGGFDVYRDGTVLHLLRAEFDAAPAAGRLLYRRSDDDGRTWTAPVRVNADDASLHAVVRGNDPQIAARGDTVMAVWTAKGSGYGGSGPLRTAISRDGGRSWQPGGNPSDTSSTAGQAYVDVIAGPEGFDLVWLDARDGAQGLRHAHSPDGIRWSGNGTIKKATCECCWNTLARSERELFVMVRGKAPRDMLLFGRGAREQWARLATVGAFDWDFQGCPHTGGGLAIATAPKPLMHAVVWTGVDGSEGLHYLRSADRGNTWSAPYRVGSTDARRADVAASADDVLVVWDQFEAGGSGTPARSAIYAMRSRDQGLHWQKPVRLPTSADASYPRVVPIAAGFLVLWTEAHAGGDVLRMMPFVTSRIALEASPPVPPTPLRRLAGAPPR